jgi:hypothetical protein
MRLRRQRLLGWNLERFRNDRFDNDFCPAAGGDRQRQHADASGKDCSAHGYPR